jgi:hypothetical protein
MRHSENEKKVSRKRDLKKSRLQKKRKNVLIMKRKDISRGNAVFSRLTVQSPTTSEKKRAERLNRNPSLTNRGRLSAAEIPIKSFLLWSNQTKKLRKK